MFKFVVLACLVAVSLARPQGPPATHQLKGHQLEKKVHAVPVAIGHVPLAHPAPASTVHTAPLLVLAIPDAKYQRPVKHHPQHKEHEHEHDHEEFRHHEESEEFGSDEEDEEEGGHERIHHDW